MAAASVAALGLTACGGQDVATGGDSTGDGAGGDLNNTLIIGMDGDANILDPHASTGWITWRVGSTIYETLVAEDLTQDTDTQSIAELAPGLAADWDISEDGTEYTFYLQEGVQFHDGTEFDADAVEYNIRRMWDEDAPQYEPAASGGMQVHQWRFLEDIEVVDDHTITLSLEEPFEPFLRLLADGGNGAAAMISPDALEEHGSDIANNPVGTGPFVFESRSEGESVEVLRNDDYWGDAPALDGITFRVMSDTAARTAAIRSGEVDMIWGPSPDSIEGLVDDGFVLADGITPHIWFGQFNMEDEYIQIPEVRQAINMAIDREGMTEDLLQRSAAPAYDFQSPSLAIHQERLDHLGYDPDRARELLEEAGVADEVEISLITSIDGSGMMIAPDIAEWIQNDLAEVGIDMSIETMELVSYFGHRTEVGAGDDSITTMSHGLNTPYWWYMQTHSNFHHPDGANNGWYTNEELDEAMDAAVGATTEEEAIELWQRAHEISAEDPPQMPVVHDRGSVIHVPEVEGFVVPAQMWYDLSVVSLNYEE